MDELCDQIEGILKKAHARDPLRLLFNRDRFISRLHYLGDVPLLEAVLARMQQAGRIRLTDKGIGLAGHGPRLSPGEHKLLEQLLQLYREGGFQPPSVKECKQQVTKNREQVQPLVELAVSNGDLVEIASDMYLHADLECEMRRRVGQELSRGKGLTVSQIRELLGTSRKYAVPFCMYLDRIGFTRRDGDLRHLAHSAAADDGESKESAFGAQPGHTE
jgi:selenocysteine-specific elongation factor